MPYSNVPPHLTGKMDSCVKDVMAKGSDKVKAIRICYKSVVKKELDEDAMKKNQREAQRKAKRQAAQLRALAKKEAVQEEIEEVEDDEEGMDVLDELGEEDEVPVVEAKELEETEKDYGMSMDTAPMMQPVSMPTSFEELDQQKLEAERSDALHEETWNVKTLVNNILCDPDMDVSEKSSAIQAVGTDFAARAQDILGASDEAAIDESKELDLLELEALIARNNRQMTLADVVKAKLSYAQSKALPDSAYALVRTETGTSGKKIKVRKYKIHDKSHVINALARAAQQIKGGNAQDAADARAALPKIHAAAKRFGIGSAKKERNSAILIEKDAAGDWRWVGWVSNNFIDWDGDIIAESAHKEYVEWLNQNWDVAPVFDSWHIPGTARTYPVDFATYEKGFLVMSGKLTEKEASGLLEAQKLEDLGMSHGAFFFSRDPNDPRVVTKYRMYAASDLPVHKAANPWTDFEVITKEVGMDKLTYLTAILGSKEKAEKFLEKTGLKQKALQDAAVPSAKEKQPDETTAQKPPETPPVAAPAPDQNALIEAVKKEIDLEGLNAFVLKALEDRERLATLEAVVKDLQKSKDEEVAEMLTPPASRAALAWSTKEARASASPETIVKEDDPLVKSVPGLGENWLSDATGTTPVKVDAKV